MKQLSQAAMSVLEAGLSLNGHNVTIKAQLDRKLYTEVNAALEALGGKWNRGAKAHVFAESPEDVLERILLDGGFHDAKQELQQFFTPAPLATRLVREADVRPGMTVLEPSAGMGAIALAARTAGGEVFCVEKDQKCIDRLFDLKFEGKRCDFLTCAPGAPGPFDRAIMNPPFTRQQDVDHVLHAFRFLREGGKLAAIMSAGTAFRSNRKTVEFREVVARHDGSIEALPDGSFKASGTGMRTVLVTMTRR